MKIIPLSEGCFTIDQTKEFVPFNLTDDDLQKRSKGSLLVEIQPFVIITEKDIIILDCGLGYTNYNDVLQIHQNLLDHEIDPMEVTKVIISHLHKDHAGGICKFDKLLGKSFLSFPNATYYVNKDELNFAKETENPSYVPHKIETLFNSNNLVLLDQNGVIDDFIFYEQTSAHSPHHLVFWIKDNDKTVFFGADDAPQLQQMKSKFVAKYDHNGKKSMELRMKWWEKGQKEHWTFLFYHDLKSPVVEA
jgi:glyoxylase-like metal-dependent hydrolase (beta-lactamase superfamily II)